MTSEVAEQQKTTILSIFGIPDAFYTSIGLVLDKSLMPISSAFEHLMPFHVSVLALHICLWQSKTVAFFSYSIIGYFRNPSFALNV